MTLFLLCGLADIGIFMKLAEDYFNLHYLMTYAGQMLINVSRIGMLPVIHRISIAWFGNRCISLVCAVVFFSDHVRTPKSVTFSNYTKFLLSVGRADWLPGSSHLLLGAQPRPQRVLENEQHAVHDHEFVPGVLRSHSLLQLVLAGSFWIKCLILAFQSSETSRWRHPVQVRHWGDSAAAPTLRSVPSCSALSICTKTISTLSCILLVSVWRLASPWWSSTLSGEYFYWRWPTHGKIFCDFLPVSHMQGLVKPGVLFKNRPFLLSFCRFCRVFLTLCIKSPYNWKKA